MLWTGCVLIIIAGGDEAGRGAVIGPLVISIVSISKGKEGRLARIGVRDSKLLTKKKRDYLFDEIASLAEEVKVYKITNDEINRAMAGGVSLNGLEALNFARLIDSLGSMPKRIYLDSPDVVQDKFGIRVCLFSKRSMSVNGTKSMSNPVIGNNETITLISEHKADAKYPVVSGASIIAKVARDDEIDRIRVESGIDFGSGYPSDSKTVKSIKDNLRSGKLNRYIRNRWKTMEIIRQSRMDDFFA